MRYRGTTGGGSYPKSKGTFKAQMIICIVLLLIFGGINISSKESFTGVKRAVVLILTQKTDLKAEWDKIKKIFTTDESILAMNPVSDFVNPAKKCSVTKGFGVQDAGESGFHYGIDLKVDETQNIVSVADGEVTEIATSQEYGSYIVIKHNQEISTIYARLNEILPDVGDIVEKGQAIARANKEDSTIHFEIRKGETYLNPADFIDFGE